MKIFIFFISRMDKTKAKDIQEFDFSSVVPVNSSMSDFRQMYIKKQSKILLDSSTDIHRELVCKYQQCNNLLNMYLKREILTKSARVRYKMSNELWEVKMKSEEMKLTSRMKIFLQVISERGFEFLQNEGIFQDFVEIDNSSETFVLHKTKLTKLCLQLDVICPQNESPVVQCENTTVTSNYKSNKETIGVSSGKHVDRSCQEMTPLSTRPKKGILKRSRQIEHSSSSEKKDLLNVIELDDTDSEDESSNQNADEEKYDTLILNFILSLRKSIPAHTIIKQFFSRLIFPWQQNMLLVFHVGPLIQDQEIVLYQYICNRGLLKMNHDRLHRSEDEKVSDKNQGHLNIDLFIKSWLENENKLVHQFSESTESVKSSIYEYQGLEKLQLPTVRKGKSKK